MFPKGKKQEEAVDTAKLFEEIDKLKAEVDILKKECSQACGGEKSHN